MPSYTKSFIKITDYKLVSMAGMAKNNNRDRVSSRSRSIKTKRITSSQRRITPTFFHSSFISRRSSSGWRRWFLAFTSRRSYRVRGSVLPFPTTRVFIVSFTSMSCRWVMPISDKSTFLVRAITFYNTNINELSAKSRPSTKDERCTNLFPLRAWAAIDSYCGNSPVI